MLKDHKVAKKVGEAISAAVDEATSDVVDQYADLKGHEESVSSQLMSEFNIHLLRRISEQLNKKQIRGVTFSVYDYKKGNEEPVTGADLGVIVDIRVGSRRITKFILIQSKVADSHRKGEMGQVVVKANSEKLKKQVQDMLAITNEAYVALYSPLGVHVIPASEVVHDGGTKVNTKTMHYRTLGKLMENVFRCDSGHVLILGPLDTDYHDLLKSFAKATSANSNLLIAATTTDNQTKPGA